MNKHEQKFYTALSDLFVGAEVDGVGGFIKLMKFKRQYYQSIEKLLKRDIDIALEKQFSFREELFDKLYQFFSLYFTQNGCIYFNHTPFHNQIYDKVYNGKDVALFWKTNMLYYVKSDKLWRSLPIKYAGYDFYIDATGLEQKATNTKNGLVYTFQDVTKTPENKPQINFVAKLSSNGNKTKADDIRKELAKHSINLSDEEITKVFAIFEKQNEVDYFINKDAKAFLSEQFKLWIYQYFWNGSDDWSEVRVQQLTILKNIANKVINFIGQFEDELVKIWNKPKFVRNSNYVVTLDKLIAKGLDITILTNHANIDKQIQEWKDLGIVQDEFNINEITQTQDMFADSKYKYLPFDTKHFDQEVKYAILALFDNLDDECDGLLIKSDNYQALNTLKAKYNNKVKCIYIDPPYNTGNDGFIYTDGYNHATWLTMMENRLIEARDKLADDGVIFISIDDKEQANLKLLCDKVFGVENFIAQIMIVVNPGGRDYNQIAVTHEYLLVYSASDNIELNEIEKKVEFNLTDNNGGFELRDLRNRNPKFHSGNRPNLFYPIYINPNLLDSYGNAAISLEKTDEYYIEVKPYNSIGSESVWRWGTNKISKNIVLGLPNISNVVAKNKTDGGWIVSEKSRKSTTKVKSIWNETEMRTEEGTRLIRHFFGSSIFDHPKPCELLKKVIEIGATEEGCILDFFAGSGTTGHAVINLNREDGGQRKYTLVEMGSHFDNIVLPRIKKVIYTDNWKDGKAQDNNGISQLVKYYELEQYEETLAKCQYKDHEVFDEQNPYSSYVFMADEKLLTSVVSIANKQAKVDLTKLYPDIDIAETLSNLLGKKIAKQSKDSVTFTDGETIDLTNLDLDTIKPLLWWS